MFLFSRVTLLGLFATIGAGLAVCVVLTTTPEAKLVASDPRAAVAESPREPAVSNGAAVATGTPRREEDRWVPPPPPPGPVVVQPSPARTYEVQSGESGGSDPRLLKLLETLEERLAPAAEPAPNEPPPPSVPSPGESPAVSPPPAVEEPAPKAKIVPSHPGEGDGRLTINLQDADLREVLDLLSAQGNLNILASNAVQGRVSASLNGVDLDSALDAILRSTGFVMRREGKFIYVGTPQDFENMAQSLDRIGTRVYRPNYVAAHELQTLIQPLITPKVGVVSVSAPSEVGIPSDDTKAGGNAFAGGEVVLVRDYEAVLAQVDQVVAEIDVRPLQVAIEAMILSVKLTDKDKLGINWELLRQKMASGSDHGLTFQLGQPSSFTGTGALSIAFIDSHLGVFLDALEELNDTNVIASPRLTVMNKQRAEIQIGRQQGYVSSTVQTETSTTANMQMLDTGTILRLRPFISADGLIRMEVHPELSSGEVIEKANSLVPDKEITQVTTNIMVRDGCTVVIGGLLREELKAAGAQIPLVGSLPLVGPLLRSREETIERHEILVLITPHIVYDPELDAEGTKAACEFHRRQAVYAEKMNPFGRRSVARRYFRLAQNAWANGDRSTALRFAEMAVHFDPTNRAAIDLRSDIWLGNPVGDHTLGGPGPVEVAAPLDQAVLSPWLLEELQQPPQAAPIPMHPLDPGVPGPRKEIVPPRRVP